MMQLARHPFFLLFFFADVHVFSSPPVFRAGILEIANESEGGEEIHKGFVMNAQATITTKTLKGEKMFLC